MAEMIEHEFGLVEYQKVFHLDADTLVVKNIDEVFERDIETLGAAPEIHSDWCVKTNFIFSLKVGSDNEKGSTTVFCSFVPQERPRSNFRHRGEKLISLIFTSKPIFFFWQKR